MKLNQPRSNQKSPAAPGPRPAIEQEYGEISPENIVEHLSVPGFLRRVHHRWHMQDINRYGDAVGKSAEALQLAYLTRVDMALGVIRIFPVSLLKRIYETLAPQFGWPMIIEGRLEEKVEKVLLRKLLGYQRMDKILQTMLATADTKEAQSAITVVRDLLEEDSRKIRESQPEPQTH